jgi:hypothetical protein
MIFPGWSRLEMNVTAPPNERSMPIRTCPLSRNVIFGGGNEGGAPKQRTLETLKAKQQVKRHSRRRSFFMNFPVVVWPQIQSFVNASSVSWRDSSPGQEKIASCAARSRSRQKSGLIALANDQT